MDLDNIMDSIKKKKQKMRDEHPELNDIFDKIEQAVDSIADNHIEKNLMSELSESLNGRLESEIGLNDDYWDVRKRVQKELVKLKG